MSLNAADFRKRMDALRASEGDPEGAHIQEDSLVFDLLDAAVVEGTSPGWVTEAWGEIRGYVLNADTTRWYA